MTRTAILYTGSAYNVKFSIKSTMENLVIPNNADVFVVTERRCLRRKTAAGDLPEVEDWDKWLKKDSGQIHDLDHPLTDEEMQLIKDTFGDRLKGFYIFDDMQDYKNYILMKRDRMMMAANEYRKYNIEHGIKPPFVHPIDHLDNGNLRCVVDQFHHVKKGYDFMCEYENTHGFKYDYVMRARIDFIVPEKLSVEHYVLPHDKSYWHILGTVLEDPMPFSSEYCWFSRRELADQIYPALENLGTIVDRKYETYYQPQDTEFRFCAETQFALLIQELNIPWIKVNIYRSAQYTNGGDGYDYMNYKFKRNLINTEREYRLLCECPSDINEHLPKLKEYALKCDHITEFGARYCNSTVAFMAAYPKKFISYDVTINDRIEYVEWMAKDCGINFHFRLENVEQIEIEETDLLFIDTNHHARQCSNELRLHADKVRKYIIFHDVETFGYGETGGQGGEPGLWLAINPFLESHPEWTIAEHFRNNNGLLIIQRNGI